MASWFSEGTVSVQNGSPTVTGVGTKFSNCRAGDMFVGPDQGIYQVINPASDTSLSISPAYRGAAVGGAGYGIVPVNGYPKALADAVNQMVQQWGATLAGLGDVSTEDVVPFAKGGTGASSLSEAKTALGISDAITGGSNANGTFIKLPDGTMICHATRISIQATANVRADTYLTLPAAFLANPTLVPTIEYPSGSDGNGIAVKRFTGTATGASAALIQVTPAENNTYMVGYIAVGRWK